jgi:hypothetical protein
VSIESVDEGISRHPGTSLPGGELPGVDPELLPGCVARSPGRGWRSVLAGAVGERLGGGVQLLACDVGIAAHGREVCVTEVLGDQAGVAGGLAQPRRGGVAECVRRAKGPKGPGFARRCFARVRGSTGLGGSWSLDAPD